MQFFFFLKCCWRSLIRFLTMLTTPITPRQMGHHHPPPSAVAHEAFYFGEIKRFNPVSSPWVLREPKRTWEGCEVVVPIHVWTKTWAIDIDGVQVNVMSHVCMYACMYVYIYIFIWFIYWNIARTLAYIFICTFVARSIDLYVEIRSRLVKTVWDKEVVACQFQVESILQNPEEHVPSTKQDTLRWTMTSRITSRPPQTFPAKN